MARRTRERPTAHVDFGAFPPQVGYAGTIPARVIVLSTGRGDIRIDWHEAGQLADELQACRREVGLAATKAQKRAVTKGEG